MPEICCTIAVTPLVRELVLYLAEQEHTYSPDSKTARLAAVLLEHIPDVPVEALHLPVSDHPKSGLWLRHSLMSQMTGER